LRDFWRDFIGAVDETKDLKISQVLDALDALLAPHLFPPRADGSDPRLCPTCGTGRLSLKLSKFGAFIGCSNYPDCRHIGSLTASSNGSAESSSKKLGEDPVTGLDVTVRNGRFGPYLQLGETIKGGDKPKRASLPKGISPDDIDLDRAIALLSLPRDVGPHPEDGEPIRAGIGRYGPYVQHGKTYANLENADEVFTIGLNRAVTLIAEKIAKGPRRRFGADPGRSLGDHPTKGGAVVAKKGRYGPYVSHDGVNATLPSDKTPETVTLEEAVALIDARAARNGPAPHARPRKAKRPSPMTARHIKAKRPAKPPVHNKHSRKTTQAAE
jgi:DNA topoisomerase I